MDAKEILEKIKTICDEKLKVLDNIEEYSRANEWRYVLYLITDNNFLNERYDFYTLSSEEFDEKYPQLRG